MKAPILALVGSAALLAAVACGTGYAVRHTVGTGEDLAALAAASDTTEAELRRLNRLGAADRLRPGDIIFLPRAPKAGSSGASPAFTRLPPPAEVRPSRPTLSDRSLKWPAAGEILRAFGKSEGTDRRGIDLATVNGEVVAAAAGRVTYAGTPSRAYGPLLILDHGDSLHTVYASVDSLQVKRGDDVRAGQRIATAREKVHFEVRRNGEPMDPLLALPPR